MNPAQLDVRVDVETPEQIAFAYSIAGIGSRATAAAADAAICVATLIVLFILTNVAAGWLGVSRHTRAASISASWILAISILIQFVVIWGYYVLFEGIWDGQTPGKRLMKLRVVLDGGFSVTFGASAVRNLLRLVDAMPIPVYLVGIIAALSTRSRKRVGDIVAGTLVVREERTELRSEARETPRESGSLATQLTDDEYALLERYVMRRQSLDEDKRRAIAAQLIVRFARYLPRDRHTSGALIRLYDDEQSARANGVAARSDTGAKREQHAIVALGLKRWNDFGLVLDRAYATGLKGMSAEQVSALVARYREITTDLARLQTATRGRDSDALFYLSRLVARGHSLLYRQQSHTMGSVVRYVFWTVPREVRRSWRQIMIAVVLLFGPAVIAYTAVVHDPAVASQLLPDEMLSRASVGSEREKRGEGYVSIDEEMRPIAASAIISNNVTVTYVVFALGLTAGIGTVVMLVVNGVSIGSAVGLFAVHRIAHLILAFVAPHGVLELSAICIAGGGGLLIAQAIVLPGDRTRRDALVQNGGRAINLIAASTFLLLIAGTLEGLISPRVWPIQWKVAVSIATAVMMLGYLSLGRGDKNTVHATVQSVA